jgi:CHAD domain-containing protein
MLKNNIIAYLNSNTDIFLKNYASAIKIADVDSVHNMRVSLKRIDTLIRMLNHKEKSNFRIKKCFKPLKRLFKLAGPLRDFQVQLQILDEIKKNISINEQILSEFNIKKNLLHNEFLQKNGLLNPIKMKRNFKIVEQFIRKTDLNKLVKKIEIFEKNRKKLLKEHSNEVLKSFSLHKARKMIKDLGHLIEMANQKPLSEIPQYRIYKETGHFLGIWHDMDVMIQYLEKLYSDLKIASELSLELYSTIKERKEKLKLAYFDKYKAWGNV